MFVLAEKVYLKTKFEEYVRITINWYTLTTRTLHKSRLYWWHRNLSWTFRRVNTSNLRQYIRNDNLIDWYFPLQTQDH